jgi:hypothetical protein
MALEEIVEVVSGGLHGVHDLGRDVGVTKAAVQVLIEDREIPLGEEPAKVVLDEVVVSSFASHDAPPAVQASEQGCQLPPSTA